MFSHTKNAILKFSEEIAETTKFRVQGKEFQMGLANLVHIIVYGISQSHTKKTIEI